MDYPRSRGGQPPSITANAGGGATLFGWKLWPEVRSAPAREALNKAILAFSEIKSEKARFSLFSLPCTAGRSE